MEPLTPAVYARARAIVEAARGHACTICTEYGGDCGTISTREYAERVIEAYEAR
jgi:hypothetical protein